MSVPRFGQDKPGSAPTCCVVTSELVLSMTVVVKASEVQAVRPSTFLSCSFSDWQKPANMVDSWKSAPRTGTQHCVCLHPKELLPLSLEITAKIAALQMPNSQSELLPSRSRRNATI
jgi:hypothetical protein